MMACIARFMGVRLPLCGIIDMIDGFRIKIAHGQDMGACSGGSCFHDAIEHTGTGCIEDIGSKEEAGVWRGEFAHDLDPKGVVWRTGHQAILNLFHVGKGAFHDRCRMSRQLRIKVLQDLHVHVQIDAAHIVKNKVSCGIHTVDGRRIGQIYFKKPSMVLPDVILKILVVPQDVFVFWRWKMIQDRLSSQMPRSEGAV